MNYRVLAVCAAIGLWAGPSRADEPARPEFPRPSAPDYPAWAAPPVFDVPASPISVDAPRRPLLLDESPPPTPFTQLGNREDEQVNNGGAQFRFDLKYLNRYVYRGVDQTTLGHRSENALQFDGKTTFDLGPLPHPFVGLFVNLFNEDPVSRFEEVRPYAGLEWTIRPLTLAGGFDAYIYPNRKPLDTTDVWASLTFDDSRIFKAKHPLISPYIYGAFDVALYHGFYVETGIKHDFVFEDLGATVSAYADVAYVVKQPYFAIPGKATATGFQHFDLGLTASYSMNTLFNFSRRYGEWSVVGYLCYSEGIANHLRGDTRLWGGVGMRFDY